MKKKMKGKEEGKEDAEDEDEGEARYEASLLSSVRLLPPLVFKRPSAAKIITQ
jgi:hypothetical protein